MKIQILDRAKKKRFIGELADFGLSKIPELLIRSGKERIRAYSGDLSTEQIMEIWRMLPIEGIGLYVAKDMMNRNGVHEVRLSLDGMHVWKDQLTGRNFVLTEEQEVDWFKGEDIELSEGQLVGSWELGVGSREEGKKIKEGFVCVKSADGKDFIGTGKLGNDGKTLFGFLPKERRRKSQTI